jgi:hypothetical protein
MLIQIATGLKQNDLFEFSRNFNKERDYEATAGHSFTDKVCNHMLCVHYFK